MASNPPGNCCTQGYKFEGTPQGSFIDIEDKYNTYVTGDKKSPKVLLFLTDVLGHKFINLKLLADAYARAGYYVVSPDMFNGDAQALNMPPSDWPAWLGRHTPDDTEPAVHAALEWIKSELKPQFIASIGYCFGARYVIRLLGEGSIDVGAGAHPSLVQIDEVARIQKPIAIFAAEKDEIYSPQLRAETETKLAEIKATYHTTLSSGVAHGFTIRGDPNDSWMLTQANRVLDDSLWWFSQFEPSYK